MVLHLSAAATVDVDQIAAVHLAAFDSNALLHAQFPTLSSRAALQQVLSQEMFATIQNDHSGKVVLVVRDTDAENQIISFAKWDLPGLSKDPSSLGSTWPEDCQEQYLNEYYDRAEAAKNRVVGDQPCYRKLCISFYPALGSHVCSVASRPCLIGFSLACALTRTLTSIKGIQNVSCKISCHGEALCLPSSQA